MFRSTTKRERESDLLCIENYYYYKKSRFCKLNDMNEKRQRERKRMFYAPFYSRSKKWPFFFFGNAVKCKVYSVNSVVAYMYAIQIFLKTAWIGESRVS